MTAPAADRPSANLDRLLAPRSIAIVGLSADPTKHGGRVLANLRRLGYGGSVWGVNPRPPRLDGIDVVADIGELPDIPDLVVCAVPAAVVPGVVRRAGEVGAGAAVVFAGGFAERGEEGARLQQDLVSTARDTGIRVLGPNSGGVIRPGAGLAASFLTCLDRPADQIRSGPVGLVTQSGGMGSYIHNLAAAVGGGLAVSISTGNEADLGLADGVASLTGMDEVRAIALVLETVRDGPGLTDALTAARQAGKPVVACLLGTSRPGQRRLATHTGALATPTRVLEGVLTALGVTIADTPEELWAIAELMARTPPLPGDRVAVVTHSGGMAILLTDLAAGLGIPLPEPGAELRAGLEPLLELGSADNPLDMGGIIGGPSRFAEVVDAFARAGDHDAVLAVSTAHPPAHSHERASSLVALDPAVPVLHLWMAGDVGEAGLDVLRTAGVAVATEPRAAMKAVAGLTRLAMWRCEPGGSPDPRPVQAPRTEHEAKLLLSEWGLRVVPGGLAATADEAAAVATRLGSRLVLKVSSPDIRHKTELGGVVVGIDGPEAARAEFDRLVDRVRAQAPWAAIDGVRVERMSAGVEAIVGLTRDPIFGPVVMVGLGGVAAEGLDSEQFAPAPVPLACAGRLVRSVRGLETAVVRRGGEVVDAMDRLAALVSAVSVRFVASGLDEMEMNPVVWTGEHWEILDAMVVSGQDEGERDMERQT